MTQTLFKLMKRTDMIDMDMCCERNNRLALSQAQRTPQWHEPHAEVHNQIGLAPFNKPDIGSKELMNVRFPNARYSRVYVLVLKPAAARGGVHRLSQWVI
jgi:hypothetical protein